MNVEYKAHVYLLIIKTPLFADDFCEVKEFYGCVCTRRLSEMMWEISL